MRDPQKYLLEKILSCSFLLASGCGSVGWLPSISLAVAGIDRVEQRIEQSARRAMIFHAEGRLIWKLYPSYYSSPAKSIDDRFSTISDLDYRMCRTDPLCEWEITERTRLINETITGVYP
jgi:hypothetical protein